MKVQSPVSFSFIDDQHRKFFSLDRDSADMPTTGRPPDPTPPPISFSGKMMGDTQSCGAAIGS